MFIKIPEFGYLNLLKLDYIDINNENSVFGSTGNCSFIIQHFSNRKDAEKYLNKLVFKTNELLGGQI